ncbi:MAG: C39 family peptidase [Verrucomicrobia bacterium]|nr:C39 family peptidase [Verrucomicrobiota bacterium]
MPAHFLSLTNFSDFTKVASAASNEVVLTSPVIRAPAAWDELVLSWNASAPPGTWLHFEARGVGAQHATRFYSLGIWTEDDTKATRESVNGQRDDDGDVKTDTLVLKHARDQVQLQVTFHRVDEHTEPHLKFLGLSLLDSRTNAAPREPLREAWGKTIEVPQRSQVPFGERQGWCSPTATSMVLAHWAGVLKRPELEMPVPEVARGVFDKNWPGTGNWPFNTAFAGKFPGLRAYAVRLNNVTDLEHLVVAGIAPVVSISYNALKGKPEAGGSGHLIVCVGFTSDGAVVVNDPWARLDRGETVRKIFPRENLIAAWRASHNTAYLIYPEEMQPLVKIFSQ